MVVVPEGSGITVVVGSEDEDVQADAISASASAVVFLRARWVTGLTPWERENSMTGRPVCIDLLLGSHANAAIHTNGLAIEVVVLDDVISKMGEFVGPT